MIRLSLTHTIIRSFVSFSSSFALFSPGLHLSPGVDSMDPALRGWIHHVSVRRYLSGGGEGDLNRDSLKSYKDPLLHPRLPFESSSQSFL